MWEPTRLVAWFAAASLAGVAIVGCGDDDGEGADVERYCELVRELDAAGSEAFAEVGEDPSATEEDFAEVERQFLEDHQDDLDELRDVAPEEIAEDVDVLLAALEDRAAGGEQQEVSDEVVAAEERIAAFEEANCEGSE